MLCGRPLSQKRKIMITTTVPETWRDLQARVGQILSECGFETEVEKTVATARGKVEIDVYAQETVHGRAYTIISECKHWRAAVPQTVIHGFRTVVADTGAHKGYIISMNGFQSGSFSAAELTNVELVTWTEFQEAFEPSWLTNFFAPTLLKRLGGLMTHAEPFVPMWFRMLSKKDQKAFIAAKEKHTELGWLAQHLGMHPITRARQPFPTQPLKDSLGGVFDLTKVPPEVATARGYREVLDALLRLGEQALAELQAFQAKAR
jgi:restriction system protein